MPTFFEFKIFILTNLIQIFWTVFILVGGHLMMRVLYRRVARISIEEHISGTRKRTQTVLRFLLPAGNVTVFGAAFIAFLQIFGIDPLPILAGASVFGFALGFGAQTLIKDFISGVFIFVENQYAVGDRVKIGNVEGVVHKIGARSTVILDQEGNFVFVPNGTINNVVNYSLGAHHKQRGHEFH